MGAGSLELNSLYFEGRGRIVSGMSALAGALIRRDYPSLTLWSDVYENVDHVDSFFPAAARGMRRFYARTHPFTAI